MGKFSINSISGFGEENKKENTIPEERYMLGDDLLDDKSRDIVKLKISNIERKKIKKNPKNNYSIDNIEELKESIKNYGLAEPINVRRLEDGNYMLLGGERRITAIDMLIADDTVEDWNEYTLIPCVVKDLDKIKLPLSDENKEKYAIITTNKEARKYSDADKYSEMQAWKEIIEELRLKGVESITGEDENGEKNKIQIKGEKTRDILANATGMSRGQVQRFEKVHNNADPDLLNAMLDDNISVGVAEKAASMLKSSEQKKLAEESKHTKIKPSDVEKFRDKEETKELTSEQFVDDIANIENALASGKVVLTEREEAEYHKIINKLEKIIVKG